MRTTRRALSYIRSHLHRTGPFEVTVTSDGRKEVTPCNRTSETGVTLSSSAATRRKTATVILGNHDRADAVMDPTGGVTLTSESFRRFVVEWLTVGPEPDFYEIPRAPGAAPKPARGRRSRRVGWQGSIAFAGFVLDRANP